MERFAVINSFLICTAFANTNVYNSTNGWIPLRFTDVSNQIKSVFKDAAESNMLWNGSASQEETPKENEIIAIPQMKTAGSNRIFFLQPDTKETTDIFGNPTSKVSGVKQTTMTTEQTSLKESSTEKSRLTTQELQHTLSPVSLTTDADMVDRILKTEPNDIKSNNKTEGQYETSTINTQKEQKLAPDNRIDNDMNNFYEKVIMNGHCASSTEIASIEQYYRGKDFEVTEPPSIAITPGYIDNENDLRNKPLVVPISNRNEVNNKLANILKKYNSKPAPMFNNYAASKTNFNDYSNMFNIMYRHQRPSLIAIPFRYNVLNHLPVNPLLAVFISNYGYTLQDTDAQMAKNVYGYSNNIHGHGNPFSPYKILPDTDSSL